LYTITFPIHVYKASEKEFYMPAGLARDVLAQLKCGDKLNIIVPQARSLDNVESSYFINIDDHEGLQITMLPYSGPRSFYLNLFSTIKILRLAASRSTVWHSGCSTSFFDLTTLGFLVGRIFARKLRVLCLDSDPASMLEKSGSWGRWKAPIIRAKYQRWLRTVDAAIFVGSGIEHNYKRFARRYVTTGAVWLNSGDIASEIETIKKFESDRDVVRICLPSRLTRWKGADDAISAFAKVGSNLPAWKLDIIGEGPERQKLKAQAGEIKTISFVEPVDYGEAFFSTLRTYHLVLIPTRGLEETRIAYDAAASGCVIIHSGTPTLQNALAGLVLKWQFEPGNVDSLVSAITLAFQNRSAWISAAIGGIRAMEGRTIQEMHNRRSEFFRSPMR
jgi:glycosyltransferase involved in cell wall biosynthesis